MRTTTEIAAQINKIRVADKAYNRFVNEGGEGYERNSVPQALIDEYKAADKAEFLAVWTAGITTERRAAWNGAINAHVAKHGSNISVDQVKAIEQSLGYKLDDIKRAKSLHSQ